MRPRASANALTLGASVLLAFPGTKAAAQRLRNDWARKDTVMPPGPENPMGQVKLLIGGLYYVHGTPLAASIGHAASHGSMRMHQADAVALASLIKRSARKPVTVILSSIGVAR